jgi:flagellar hook-associated protein 1 FlgK
MLAKEVAELNQKIITTETVKGSPNDLLDKRDLVMKKLASLADVTMYKDKKGNYNVDLKGIGPLVTGHETEKLTVERSPADDQGKPENSFDIRASSTANGIITHGIKGGKLGALLETRDKTLSTVMTRLDGMAFSLSDAVNRIHKQGVTSNGETGVGFFKDLVRKERAAEFISLSDDIHKSINNIATGLLPDAPGDNRVAIAISQIQSEKFMNDGHSTFDEYYNSIVSDVGVVAARNRFTLNQQKDITTQLGKVRDQISGVSIDEETTNLLQFQHIFDASAKIIQVADDLLKTVLALKRD